MSEYHNCETPDCSGMAKGTFKKCYNCNMKAKEQKPVQQQTFRSSSEYKSGDEMARMSAAKTAAEICPESCSLKMFRQRTMIIYDWIKTGKMDIDHIIEEELVK